jgi:hypothetical protein
MTKKGRQVDHLDRLEDEKRTAMARLLMASKLLAAALEYHMRVDGTDRWLEAVSVISEERKRLRRGGRPT